MASLDFITDTSVSTPGRRYAGYFTTLVQPLDGQVRNDKVLSLSIQPVVPNPNGDTLFIADHLASDAYQVAIGLADQAPTSGTFKLTVNGSSTNLTALAYNISAADLQTPLSAAMVAGGESACTVTLVATGVYSVQATTNGAVATGFIVSDASNLFPTSGVIVNEVSLGSASTPYRYTIIVRQQPMCFGTPSTQLPAQGVTASNSVQAMSATANQISSIAFTVDPVGGSYLLTVSALGVSQTYTVPAVITANGLAAILAQHPKITWTEANDPDNNIAVTKSGSAFYVEFYGTLGPKRITSSTVDAAALTVIMTATDHGYTNGQTVTHSSTNSTPNTDGSQVVTYISATTYSVPVDVTVAGTFGYTRDSSAPSLSATNVSVVGAQGVSGTINLNTENLHVYSVAQTGEFFVLYFTITRTRANGEVRTIYGPASITLAKELVDPTTMVPTPLPSYYTAAQSDARYGQLATSNTWTGGNNTFTGGAIAVGEELVADGSVTFLNSTNSFTHVFDVNVAPTADRTLTLPDLSGTLALVNAAQSWTAAQTYGDGYLKLSGSTSGASTLKAPAIASTYVHTLPDSTVNLMGWQEAINKSFIHLRDEFLGGGQGTGSYGTIGELGWSAGNIVAANLTDYVVGEANHWGIVRVKSNTTSGNGATLALNFGAAFSETGRFPALNATTGWKLRFIVRPESITSVDMRIGLTDDFNGDGPPTNGIWWEFESASDTKWTPVCRAAGTETEGSTTNSVNAGAGTWVTLDIYCDSSGTISFSADGGTAITIATNVPSANLSPCLIVKTGTSASRYLDIDFFALQMTVSR